jgi:nitrate reductase gamma subunit
MGTTDAAPRVWLRNFGHYTIWFVTWGALLSFLQPVTTDQMAGTSFWAVKVQQAMLGAGFGVICAIAFTLLQNGLNQSRRKWISWLLAIGTWLTMNLALAFAMGRFG